MNSGIAILGTGLAAEIHSKTLKAIAPGVRRYYASRDRARAAAIAARFGGAGHFGSYEEAIASKDIDVVLVGLPPSLHRQWTLHALAAGKHVIVEKPPFLTTKELDEVGEAAARAGRQVMVAENYFYKPLTTLLRTTIASGDLGDLLLLQLNALKSQKTGDWRDDGQLAGGGALFEGGIHWVSLLANMGLTPRRIRAGKAGGAGGAGAGEAGRAGGPGGAGGKDTPERTVVLTIEYAEGPIATLSYSWDLGGLINGVRMSRAYGTAGTLRFETNGIFAVQTGRRRRLTIPGVSDLAGYRAMMKDFITAIEESRPPRYTLALARRDLQLVEEAYASLPGSSNS